MSSKPIPKKIFVRVWVALLALLALTWGLAQLNLGRLNAVVALTIAIVKMLLVLLYFMHVRYSSRLTWIFVAAGFIWFLIMVDLTLGDYRTRGQVPGNPLRLMTGFQRLPNGNTVCCNYLGHGHLGAQPHVFELTPDKQVVWEFADHAHFKTINQIQLLDVPGDPANGDILR